MEAKRFFVPATDSKEVTISGELYNYMARVMRLKMGDEVVLCFGDGFDNLGKITSLDKKSLTVKLTEKIQNPNEPDINLTLFQSVPKAAKLDIIVQKCSELGIKKIVPFKSAFSAIQNVRADRLNKIAVEAASQCGRAKVTEVREPINFTELLSRLKNDGYDFILHPYENIKEPAIKDVLKSVGSSPKNIAVIIGSEGGFSQDEADKLKDIGARWASLGPRVLRTETAAACVSAIVMYEFDQLRFQNEKS